MIFQLTEATTCAEFPFYENLTKKDIDKILNAVNYDFGQMSIGDFCELIEDGASYLSKKLGQKDSLTVFDYVVWTAGVSRFTEFIFFEVKKFEPPANDRRLQIGIPKISITESIYIFLRDFFGLPNFLEVEKLRVTDYLLAAKSAGIQSIINFNAVNNVR